MVNDRITIKVTNQAGEPEERDVLMTYGLLNALVRVLGDPSRTASLDLDPDLAEQVLILTLIPRQPTGKPKVAFDDFELPGITPEEAFRLFDWVKESVLDFFVKRLKKTLDTINERKEDLGNIGSSINTLTG